MTRYGYRLLLQRGMRGELLTVSAQLQRPRRCCVPRREERGAGRRSICVRLALRDVHRRSRGALFRAAVIRCGERDDALRAGQAR
jgi:hypothetical protein